MNTLQYSLSLATAAFTGPMRAAQGAMKGFASSAGNIGSAITGMASLPGLIKSLVEPLTNPITLSGDLEALETSFKSLLKSAPNAKTMVADLMAFADATPFDPVPVAAAGKQLLAFGFAAKTVKPLLGDIGDLAAAMQKPIEEVAGVFGRLNASDFGEAFERLRDFGVTRLDLIGEGLKFDKGGSFLGSADQALTAVRTIIRQKFGGGMADLSTTFRGLFSTFSGYWDGLQRAFGKPIMQALKPLLQDGTGELQKWTPLAEEWGAKVGAAIDTVRGLSKDGKLWDAASLGLKIAGKELVNILFAGVNGTVNAFFTGLGEGAKILGSIFSNASLMEGLKMGFLGIGELFKAQMFEAAAAIKESLGLKDESSEKDKQIVKNLQEAMAKVQAQRTQVANAGGDTSRLDETIAGMKEEIGRRGSLREQARFARGDSKENFAAMGDLFGKANIGDIVQQSLQGIKLTKASFESGYNRAGNVVETGKDRTALDGLITAATALTKTSYESIAAMARDARLQPVLQTQFTRDFSDENGIRNRRETFLNPQLVGKLFGGQEKDDDSLANKMAAKIMASPTMATITTGVTRIADKSNTTESGTFL